MKRTLYVVVGILAAPFFFVWMLLYPFIFLAEELGRYLLRNK